MKPEERKEQKQDKTTTKTTKPQNLPELHFPHCEALPGYEAVNASVFFLDPVSITAHIFSYINYPNV